MGITVIGVLVALGLLGPLIAGGFLAARLSKRDPRKQPPQADPQTHA